MAFLAIRSVVHLSPAKACQLTHHTIHLIARTNGPKNVPGFRWNSTSASVGESIYDGDGPGGDLFLAEVGPGLMGKSAWIRRTFDPRSNSLSLLTCGGEALAKHASFDPEYNRARDWIRHHPVGPAVLSPVLINGLVGALVEASVPQAIPVSSSMNQIRPLIVGVSTSNHQIQVSTCLGRSHFHKCWRLANNLVTITRSKSARRLK